MSLVHVPDEAYDIDIGSASLPQSYVRAKEALQQCNGIDECKDWSDKAAALASYARQADDKALEMYAVRIRNRAIQRAGELIKTFDGRGKLTEGNQYTGQNGKREGNHLFPISQQEAAQQAGMSEHQRKTAVRLANIDKEEFDRLVDSDEPPTLTELAQRGKTILEQEKPEGFKEATRFMGMIKRLVEFFDETPPLTVISGLDASESKAMRRRVQKVDRWLDEFFVNLK